MKLQGCGSLVMTLLWSWASTFQRTFLYKLAKTAEGFFPTVTWWRRRTAPARNQGYQRILTGFLPERLLWMLKHTGSITLLYLVRKDWACHMGKLCWVNLIKGKNLETQMGTRNRNSGCNWWFLFFVRGKSMNVLAGKLKALILGKVLQVSNW